MKKKKSGVLIAIVAVSAAVAALTTLSVLAVRFIQKKRKEEEDCGEVFDYTFDGSEIEAFQADDICACDEENTAEDVPADQ